MLDLPRLQLADGTIEAIKWLALILMTGDHVNRYLFNGTLPYLFEAGRLAMPLFVCILAYNLARPNGISRGTYVRTIKRLGIFGILALPIMMGLGTLVYDWWPLNIMFTLLLMTAIIYLLELETEVGSSMAILVFVIGGALVEFWWPALALGVSVWQYSKQPALSPLIMIIASLASLWIINNNYWAMAVIPLVMGLTLLDLRIPRLKWLFYAYYPLHLAVLWLIRIPMSKAGFLFF